MANKSELAKELLDELIKMLDGAKENRRVPITQAEGVETVELYLPATTDEPFPVKWGTRQFLIPRGRVCLVPAPVAEIVNNSINQDRRTRDYIISLAYREPRA